MPPGDYVDAATGAMMTSRPAAVGGAKCQQQPMGAQFPQQVRAVGERHGNRRENQGNKSLLY